MSDSYYFPKPVKRYRIKQDMFTLTKGQHCFIDEKGDVWCKEDHYHDQPVLIKMYVRSTLAKFEGRFTMFFEELQDIEGEVVATSTSPSPYQFNSPRSSAPRTNAPRSMFGDGGL